MALRRAGTVSQLEAGFKSSPRNPSACWCLEMLHRVSPRLGPVAVYFLSRCHDFDKYCRRTTPLLFARAGW